MLFLCKRCSKNIQDCSIDKNVKHLLTACVLVSPETSMCEVTRDVSRNLQLTVCDNGVVEVSLLSDGETSI